MKLLITGASGFLGQYVVKKALASNHFVRALVRSATKLSSTSWQDYSNFEAVEADLATSKQLSEHIRGIDCVIHLVASKSGTMAEAYQGTVIATKNLLAAMEKAEVKNLVFISSFSVYNYSKLSEGDVLDESAFLEENAELRDVYTKTKLLQEEIIRQFAAFNSAEVTILRPGMIFGREALWNACHGASLGPLWLLIGPEAIMPLTYVENCAEAIVAAVESQDAIGSTLNIVDDNLPTRKAYTEALVQASKGAPQVIPVSWPFLRNAAEGVWALNQSLFAGQLRLPGLLMPARLDARFKPLTYSNQLAKQALGWEPRYSWEEALNRCFAHESKVDV